MMMKSWNEHNDANAPAFNTRNRQKTCRKHLPHVGHCVRDAQLYGLCHAEPPAATPGPVGVTNSLPQSDGHLLYSCSHAGLQP